MNVSLTPVDKGYPVVPLKHPEGWLTTADICIVVIPSVFTIIVLVLFTFYIIWKIFLWNSTIVDRETEEGGNKDIPHLREVAIGLGLSTINIE